MNLEKNDIEELLIYQQIEQRNNIFIELTKYKMNKAKTVRKKWGKLLYMHGTLEFLELCDLLKLLIVNKEWRKRLIKKIY